MHCIKYTSLLAWIFGCKPSSGQFDDSFVRRLFRYTIILIYLCACIFHGVNFVTVTHTYSLRVISFSKSASFLAVAWMFYYGSTCYSTLHNQLSQILAHLPNEYIKKIQVFDLFQIKSFIAFTLVSIVCNSTNLYQFTLRKSPPELLKFAERDLLDVRMVFLDACVNQLLKVSISIMALFYLVIIYTIRVFADFIDRFNTQTEDKYFNAKKNTFLQAYDEHIDRDRSDSLHQIKHFMSMYNCMVNIVNGEISFVALYIFAMGFNFCTTGLAIFCVDLVSLPKFYGFIVIGYVMLHLTFIVLQMLYISDCTIRSIEHARQIASRIASSVDLTLAQSVKISRNSLRIFLSTNTCYILTAWNLFEIRAQTGLLFVNSVVPFTVMTMNIWRELPILWNNSHNSTL